MYAFGLCIDQHYLVPGLATLAGLADGLSLAARRSGAVRVLTLDLTPAQALLLSDLAKRVGFGSFDLRHCSPMRTSRMADASYITVTTYLRFEFTPGFVRRPYLIYVDADVLVRGDISDPLDPLEPDETGAVRDEFNPAVGACPALPGAAERWPQLRGRPYYNAGVLWTHTSRLPTVRKGVEQALVHGRRHILHNDQDALNLWLLHSGRVRPVGAGFNRFETSRFLERGNWVRRVVTRSLRPDRNAALVHFVGPEKPWRADCPGTEDVAEYRRHMSRTLRHVRRLGAVGTEPAGAW
ncbi:glycosyltransferase family 8 protein [Streptomyces sp. NPDC085460]|uniref:glycosyltransferase family 8 protein n=1 Tax=Streptomyces sp. NPDC085460 TaxID=3365723 RepID=UPI0037D7BE58